MRRLLRLRHVVNLALVTVLVLATGGLGRAQSGDESGTLRNPLNPNNGADPWLTYYDGNYYLAATTWASTWTMRKSPTLAGLKTAEAVPIYFESEPSRCCNFWAPEFRLLDGPNGPRWYFYYTAGSPSGAYDNQRTHVLESAGTDPMGPYTYKARISEPQVNTWMIDGSVLELDGALYFFFSAFDAGLQSVFIAPMSNPWTISGPRVLISKPEYTWERVGGWVNEGPVALQHEGRTFLVYSASSCNTPDYKLGMLTLTGSDPLNRSSWEKHAEPVFQRNDAAGVFAPGHNGFFKSPDGSEDWIVYHANDSAAHGCDGQRMTRVQKINWNEDGTPDFGMPVANTEAIPVPSGDPGGDPMPEFPPQTVSRFKAFGYETAYLRHSSFVLRVDLTVNPVRDSEFVIVPGLADPNAISIESVNFPGFYWRHQANSVVLSPDDHSASFEADATWWIRPGLADESWLTFESYNQPGKVIGKQFGVTALVQASDTMTDAMREDATFLEERQSGE